MTWLSSMSSQRPSKKKDPIGTAVFYPQSLPPPPRRSSRAITDSISPGSTSLPLASPPIPPRSSSLQRQALPKQASSYADATKYPFPQQASSQSSPPSQLASRLESWNLFTPSPAISLGRRPGVFGPDSVGDLSLLSPEQLLLTDLIDDAYIQEESSPSHPSYIASTPPKSSIFGDSPALHTNLYRAHPDSNDPKSSGIYLGSPQNVLTSPFSGPIPFRQPSWLATDDGRRASVPNVSFRIAESSSTSNFYLPPSPSVHNPTLDPSPSALSRSVSLSQAEREDIFSPEYNLTSSYAQAFSDYSFPAQPPQNSLNLHLGIGPTASPTLGHEHQSTFRSIHEDENYSHIAAQHLSNRVLNLEFVQRYDLRDELGSGGFGFVCSAVQTGYENEAGVEVAVKFIFKDRIHESEYGVIFGEPVESYVMKRCRHPNIIAFLALFEDTEFFYLVQELHGDPWAPGHTLERDAPVFTPASVPSVPVFEIGRSAVSPGSVFSSSPSSDISGWSPSPRMVRPNMARRASHDLFEAVEHQRFTEDQGRTIFRQIVGAVSYLHKRGIYHRDLKDENIVIDRNLRVKIIDFGSAVFEDRLLPPVVHDHFRGTMSYASAEILSGFSYHAGPVDIWALGVILSIILTGESPFPSPAHAQVGRIKMKRRVSTDVYDLLARCVHANPNKRVTIEKLESHKWLRVPMVHRGSV